MALQLNKLAQLTGQTLNNLNLYSYKPSNSDTLADILASGYFTLSPYNNTEYGWGNSLLICELSTGTYCLQVSSDGTSAVQIGAGSQSNGTITLTAPTQALTPALTGYLLIGASGAAQTLTIASGMAGSNQVWHAYCSGAGGLTVTAGGGVTVTGNAVLATGDSCVIYRTGTNTYVCV